MKPKYYFLLFSLILMLFFTIGCGSNRNNDVSQTSDLPIPPGSGDIPRPSGKAGNLKVLDWAGFTGAVSYTFDDANSSQIDHYSELNALGVHMTFYLLTGKSEATNSIWAQAVTDGHELGNHTNSHSATGTGDDIDTATAFIENHFGLIPSTMAAPYGDASYTSLAEPRFLINRGVNSGSIAPNSSTNQWSLTCHIPAVGASASDMTSVASSARSAGSWQIFTIHGFTGGSDYVYQPVDLEEFTSSVEAVKEFGDMWIDSVINIGAYWIGQKMFNELIPTTVDGVTTWIWTKPAHFPSGKFLRVTVDGGTLKQGNQTLKWNSHGYFEVALDKGSLTLMP